MWPMLFYRSMMWMTFGVIMKVSYATIMLVYKTDATCIHLDCVHGSKVVPVENLRRKSLTCSFKS